MKNKELWTVIAILLAALIYSNTETAHLIALSERQVGEAGRYYVGYGVFSCNSEVACLHELGHLVDEQLEYPSQSAEFQADVQEHIAGLPDDCTEWAECFVGDYPGVSRPCQEFEDDCWGNYAELYATLYSYYRIARFLPEEDWAKYFSWRWEQ